jgi:dual 3',5'-cyclic-AMP and -GMP phosphodiesterase 11
MESYKAVSPLFMSGQKSRSSSCNEVSLISIIHDMPRIDTTSKHDYSDLLNKFIIIPEDIFTIKFDILKIDDTFILRNIVCYIFKTFFEIMDYQKINSICLKGFIKDVCDKYNDVSYHNFYHATHILHTTYVLLEQCELFDKLNPDVLFSILISALVHDIGHPGNNNLFEINTCSDLACTYNDLSVLEQYHCHLSFELIRKHHLFQNYTHDEFIICRKTIISCILGTDMANHKSILEVMKIKKETGFNIGSLSLDEQYMIGKIFVHAADIGNPIQEYEQCEAWARKVSLEFYLQTEKEKEKGLKPFTSFNINSSSSFYNHEIKYITYICKPYWEVLSDMFHELKPLYNKILTNYDTYSKILYDMEKFDDSNLEEY